MRFDQPPVLVIAEANKRSEAKTLEELAKVLSAVPGNENIPQVEFRCAAHKKRVVRKEVALKRQESKSAPIELPIGNP